ncbi:tetratricopeptide repeat protein [Maribacter sp. HTCC2170]|uniref:tetratricopeptide repeat protein n=1 Tax=Maribacter sp. (strain HTCC2170 / KCCM 42371) TaxID=313603 RepID=UPI00006BD3D7|nr:SH3 domain-containing protein [Maribacter sp. HTCC2170]EAR02954.1 BatE, TRP domain containing protein [Maribacter sp. HTCC2170]
MKQLLSIIVFLFSFLGIAQNDVIFNKATEAYNNGDYQTSIDSYSKILENGQHSAELYFNLGNAYYKLNQIAPSIYNYEKALLLSPNDNEIKNNLSYAQNMTLDAIETLPETGLTKIYKTITGIMTFDQWSYTAIVFMILFVLLYIAFYYFTYATKKRIAFIGSFACLFVSIIAVIFAFIQYSDFSSDQPAIVFDSEVRIKAEPNKRSEQIFILHEGTKVNVLEELNEWKKIKIVDGKTGWVTSESIKLLKDF